MAAAIAMWVVRTCALQSEDEADDRRHEVPLHQFADQIGLTPAGLKGKNW